MSRTTEIVIERDELIVVRRREQLVIAICETCAAKVEMLTPEIAAVVSGLGAREVYRLVESGQVHYTENATGLLRICARSLSEYLSTNLQLKLIEKEKES